MNIRRTTSEKAEHEFVIVSVSVCWYIDGYTPKIKFIKKMYWIIYKLELGQRNFLPLILWFTHETRKIEINLLSIMFLLTLLQVQYPQQSPFGIIRQRATSPRQYNTMQNTITTYVLVSYVNVVPYVVLPGDFAISSLEYVFAFWFWALLHTCTYVHIHSLQCVCFYWRPKPDTARA